MKKAKKRLSLFLSLLIIGGMFIWAAPTSYAATESETVTVEETIVAETEQTEDITEATEPTETEQTEGITEATEPTETESVETTNPTEVTEPATETDPFDTQPTAQPVTPPPTNPTEPTLPSTKPTTPTSRPTEPPTVTQETTTSPIDSPETFVSIKNGKTITLYVCQTERLSYTVKNPKGNTLLSTTNNKIATVDSKGKITAIREGRTEISVCNNGVKSIVKVIVKKPYLNASKKTLKVGKTFLLKITGQVGKATYKSGKSSVVSVSSKGKLLAKSEGKSTITVSTNKLKLNCKVTVNRYKQEIEVVSTDIARKEGAKSLDLKAKAMTGLTFKSTNKNVATVNKNGVITFKKPGKAKIIVTAKETRKYKKAKLTVTVEVVNKIDWSSWYNKVFG